MRKYADQIAALMNDRPEDWTYEKTAYPGAVHVSGLRVRLNSGTCVYVTPPDMTMMAGPWPFGGAYRVLRDALMQLVIDKAKQVGAVDEAIARVNAEGALI